MRRLLILVACVALGSGCQKKAEPSATSSPAPQPAATAQPAAASVPAAAPKKVEITEDLVQKYMAYQKENFALVAKYVEDTRKNLDSAKGDTAKTLQQVGLNAKLSKDLDDTLKAKRASLGLGDEEFNTVKDAAEEVAAGRLLYNQMGGDAQVAKMTAEQKKQLAALPEAQRQAAEASLASVAKSLTDVRDAVEVRQKYGDKAADVLLKHADELAQQHLEALKLLAAKK